MMITNPIHAIITETIRHFVRIFLTALLANTKQKQVIVKFDFYQEIKIWYILVVVVD